MIKVIALEGGSRVAADAPSLSLSVRITETLDYLQDQGDLSYAVIWEKNEHATRALNWANVLIVSKYVSSRTLDLVRYAKQRGVKIIYDIDDWIFSYPDYSINTRDVSGDSIITMMGLSDAVTVSNQKLKRELHAYNDNLTLLPNGMYVEQHISPRVNVPAYHETYPSRVVFTNSDFLKMTKGKEPLLSALQIFFHRHPNYILDFIGDPFPEMFSLPFLHFTNRVLYSDYLQILNAGGYQFAITPLGGQEDGDSLFFNECKNPFKYLNYGAARVPGIYSSSPIYEECIIQKETGVLIENTFEGWIDGMELLASSPALRHSIRNNAYNDVIAKHHIRFSAKVLMSLLSSKPKKIAKLGTA